MTGATYTVAEVSGLMTRKEAAEYLRVNPSRLAKGWGPSPLPDYKRPVMYARQTLDAWLFEQRRIANECSTDAEKSGGQDSSSEVSADTSRRVAEIVLMQRKRRAKYASRLKTEKASNRNRGGHAA